ncbi:MAG TPA: hypothetical protein VGJ92_05360 [Methanocella sp.]|jgi:hypothetical protein
MEKKSPCMTCRNCGAEIQMTSDKECPGCHKDVKECIVDKDVTSSVYPM